MSQFTDAGFADLSRHQSGDTLPFYQAEGQILELWDHMQELKLEQALLEAQITSQSVEQSATDTVTEEQLKDAEQQYVEARAAYTLRQSVVEDVLTADPILKAVHAGANATSAERQLHPLIDRRDALGIAQTNLSSTLQSLMANTTRLEADHAKTMETNRALAATFVDLSSKNQTLRDDAMEVASMRAHLDQAKKNTETAATRRTIMKSVVSAIVAGSGVDWARDEHLRALVLDNEDEVE